MPASRVLQRIVSCSSLVVSGSALAAMLNIVTIINPATTASNRLVLAKRPVWPALNEHPQK